MISGSTMLSAIPVSAIDSGIGGVIVESTFGSTSASASSAKPLTIQSSLGVLSAVSRRYVSLSLPASSYAGGTVRMYKEQTITVIIPCLNEEQGIEKVLTRMPQFVDEVIVVDNGSTDGTPKVARSFGARVISEDVRGYGRAYKTGFSWATGDIIITLDGDHSYPPDAISYLLEAFLHLEVDFLNASRFPVRDHSAMSLKHKIGNLALSLAMSILYLRWVRDSQSGMWVFRRSILKEMKLVSDGMAFSEEIKIEALKSHRIRFAEISILYSSRLGEMKLNPWRDGMHNMWFLVRKRFS